MQMHAVLGKVATMGAATFLVGTTSLAIGALPASASTSYSCPLSTTTVCQDPLTGSSTGAVTVTQDGYGFDLNHNGSAGYVQVSNSNIIATNFPMSFSVQVKGVGVPSTSVGDYDVVRGTPSGNWKIEVVARNNRTTARAACFYKGTSGKGNAVGGPDLASLSADTWTTITCTDTGSQVILQVNGTAYKTVTVATGSIPNPGPILIGAKNTTGGDQYSGYAKNVQIDVS